MWCAFPRFAELQRARLVTYARSLGGNDLARVLALGTGNATYQMVLGTLDIDPLLLDRAAELITSFIDGGFEGVQTSGVMAPAAAAARGPEHPIAVSGSRSSAGASRGTPSWPPRGRPWRWP